MAIKLTQENEEDINAEINMTPLIDIMLVLLIIFMVTSSVTIETGAEVELPEVSETNKSSSEKTAVFVSLVRDEILRVNGQKASWENLESMINKALTEEKTQMVILEGDRASKLGQAVSIIDVAKKAGAKKFAIAAQEN